MERPELSQLTIVAAETDEDLKALIAVRKIVTPRARPIVANLRHALESSTDGLTLIIARLGDEPVACGFVEGPAADFAPADVAVVPARRRMGIGSAVLAYVSERAQALGKNVLQVELKLEKVTPKLFLQGAHHWLILHGRYICKARKPECWRCPVSDLCAFKPKTPPPAHYDPATVAG